MEFGTIVNTKLIWCAKDHDDMFFKEAAGREI